MPAKKPKKATRKGAQLTLLSQRSRALIAIITVGIIGAGIMTIRSFAATSSITWVATEFDAPTYTTANGSKAGVPYFNFTSSQNSRSTKTMKKVNEGGSYKVCLTADASAPNIVLEANIWLGLNLQRRKIAIPQEGDFKKYCHNETINLSNSVGGYIKGGVTAVNSPLNVYVTSMSLEKVGSTSAPSK